MRPSDEDVCAEGCRVHTHDCKIVSAEGCVISSVIMINAVMNAMFSAVASASEFVMTNGFVNALLKGMAS
jgi:hypothetical protein